MKEALKLALEALEIVKIHFSQNRHVNEAITAIKQALAVPVQRIVANMTVEDGRISFAAKILADGTYDLYTTPPAQPAPVQEPVAWRYTDSRGHYRYRCYVPNFDVEYPLLKPQSLCLYTPPAAQPAPAQELYNELLFAVARVHPNETRHQTALRYIQQAESGGANQCTDAHGIKETT